MGFATRSAWGGEQPAFTELPRVWLVNALGDSLRGHLPTVDRSRLETIQNEQPSAAMGASGDAQDVEVDGGVDGDLEGARQLGRALMMLDGFVQRGYSSVLAMMQDDFIALDPSSKASARWRFHHDKVDAIESRFLALLCSAAMRAEFRPLSSGEAAFAEGTQNSKSLPVHIDWDKVEAGFLDTVPGLHEYAMNDPPHFADRLLVFHRGVGVFKTSGFFYSDKMDEVFARLTEYLRSVTIE